MASRKAADASTLEAQRSKKKREDEERLRQKDESIKAARNEQKLRRAWTVAALLAAIGVLSVALMYRKLRAANASLRNPGSTAA